MTLRQKIKIWLLVRPPKWLQRLFRKTVWSIGKGDGALYLTFDDGPVPEVTPWILDQLDRHQARATFFCVGDNVRRHPEIFEEIRRRGHAVGNHTYSHLNGYRTGTRKYLKDVYRAHRLIRSRLFRPPYGRATWLQRQLLLPRFRFIQWDVLSMDYDPSMTPAEVLQNVVGKADDGSIMVFHDNVKAWENLRVVLPQVLDHFTARGMRFRALDEVLNVN